jgi:hypothetical protein
MRATQGALIAGSAVNIVLGFSGLWSIAARYEAGAYLRIRLVSEVSLAVVCFETY